VIRKVKFFVCDGLFILVLLCAGMMKTEMGVDVELRGLSSFDVSQGVQWVKVVDLLFLDQYILLLEGSLMMMRMNWNLWE